MDKRSEQISSKKIQKENKHTKRCSASLVVREIPITTAMKYYIPIRMAKKTDHTNCSWGYKATRTLIHSWWDCKMVQPLRKIVWQCLKNLNIHLPYHLAIPHIDLYSREMTAYIHARTIYKYSKLPYW